MPKFRLKLETEKPEMIAKSLYVMMGFMQAINEDDAANLCAAGAKAIEDLISLRVVNVVKT